MSNMDPKFVAVAARADADLLITMGVDRNKVEAAYQQVLAEGKPDALDALRPNTEDMLAALGLPKGMF